MKKAFIAILLYYLIFHFIIPEIYFLIWGNVYIYSDLIDLVAAQKAFLLNTAIILGAIGVIVILPFKNYQIEPILRSNTATHLFLFSIFYTFFYLFISGGFQGVVSGGMAGSLANYLNFFINPNVLLMCVLFLQKKKRYIIALVFVYILSITLSGSRSGVLQVVLMYFISYGFKGFDSYRKRILSFIKYALLLSPVLFYLATSIRGAEDPLIWKLLFNQIIGRESFIELGMIPIHYIDNGGLDLSVLYAKYDLLHQLKLILDSVLPGQIFERDVMPNNYFRSIFFGYSEDFVINNYMSINITLPVYLYIFQGYLSILSGIVIIISFYFLLRSCKLHPYVSLILISSLYEMLVYFDWVMVFNRIYVAVLTIIFLKFYNICYRSFLSIIKRNESNVQLKV